MRIPSVRRKLVPALCALALVGAASASRADVPRASADIPPVHSLVARVTGELGQPSLVVRPGASPHGHALRPSEAAVLEASDVIFWTGTTLTPWLAREIGKLAPGAVSVELMALPGTHRLAPRSGATFEPHDHAHDDHHAHDAAAAADASSATSSAYDPHGWLDPSNAIRWLDEIAAVLGRLDPANADVYSANAAAGRRELDALATRTGERLSPVREQGFVVFHDSIRYFEERFDVHAVAALSPNDASDASPSRVHAVRASIEELDVACVFTEPQLDARRARVLVDGLDVGQGVLDPLGATLEPGADLYVELIDELARSLADCLDRPNGSDG